MLLLTERPEILNTARYSGMRGAYSWVPVGQHDTVLYEDLRRLSNISLPRRCLVNSGLHITTSYSYNASLSPADFRHALSSYVRAEYEYRAGEVTYWRGNGEGYIVLNVRSPQLCALHERLRVSGVQHDYPEYHPHVTLARGVGALDLNLIKVIDNMNRHICQLRCRGKHRTTGSLVVSDIDVWHTGAGR